MGLLAIGALFLTYRPIWRDPPGFATSLAFIVGIMFTIRVYPVPSHFLVLVMGKFRQVLLFIIGNSNLYPFIYFRDEKGLGDGIFSTIIAG